MENKALNIVVMQIHNGRENERVAGFCTQSRCLLAAIVKQRNQSSVGKCRSVPQRAGQHLLLHGMTARLRLVEAGKHCLV